MTDSEKSGGLPTAATVGEIGASHYDDLNDGDELVRRKDVKALIQDKKYEMAGYAMTQAERDIVEKFAEELLEELEQ